MTDHRTERSDRAAGTDRPLPSVFRGFLEVAGGRVLPATLSEASTAELYRSLEGLVAADGGTASVLSGFQSDRAAEPAPSTGVDRHSFRLTEGPTVPREWFTIALADRFCAALFGCELPVQPEAEPGDRQYATVWSFDPRVVEDVCRVLVDGVAAVSEPAAFAVRATLEGHGFGPAAPEVVQRFANLMFERLEAGERRWRTAADDVATTPFLLAEQTRRQLHLERMAAARMLASSVTHELNNPLASITMAASVLGALDDPDRQRRMTEIIQQQALRAGRIASQLSAYVSDGPLERSPLDLDAWISALADDYCLTGRDVTVTGRAAVTVDTDRDRLRQAVISLVDEGLAVSGEQGGVELEVSVTAEAAVIRVTDHGPARSWRSVDVMFDPLTEAATDGAGLSLAIARSHVEAIGGRLELEGSGADGSRFTILVPLDPSGRPMPNDVAFPMQPVLPLEASDGAEVARPGRVEVATSGEVEVAAPAGSDEVVPRRVLIVDDDASIRGLLEALLRRGGWDVVGTASRQEALTAVGERPFGLVLIDVRLGQEHGPEVLEALAAIQPDLLRRTAFITGAPPESGRMADCPVLAKPFGWSDVVRLITELTGTEEPPRSPAL